MKSKRVRRRPWLGEEALTKTISGFRITATDHNFIKEQADILEVTIPEYVRRLVETERKIHERNDSYKGNAAGRV